jgi:hypothetical protein
MNDNPISAGASSPTTRTQAGINCLKVHEARIYDLLRITRGSIDRVKGTNHPEPPPTLLKGASDAPEVRPSPDGYLQELEHIHDTLTRALETLSHAVEELSELV